MQQVLSSSLLFYCMYCYVCVGRNSHINKSYLILSYTAILEWKTQPPLMRKKFLCKIPFIKEHLLYITYFCPVTKYFDILLNIFIFNSALLFLDVVIFAFTKYNIRFGCIYSKTLSKSFYWIFLTKIEIYIFLYFFVFL